MKEKYWDWLTRELGKAWKIIKIMPLAFWDLFKWIGHSFKTAGIDSIRKELTWENLCILSGAFSCLFFMGGLILIPITTWVQDIMIGLAVISLFLISTYARAQGGTREK